VEIALLEKISKISAKHRSTVFESLSEIERNVKLNFTRVFPAAGTDFYDKYFDGERPFNKLVYKYLCQKTELSQLTESSKFNDLPTLKFHFKVEIPKTDKSEFSNHSSTHEICDTESSPKAKKSLFTPVTKLVAGVKLERIQQSLRNASVMSTVSMNEDSPLFQSFDRTTYERNKPLLLPKILTGSEKLKNLFSE